MAVTDKAKAAALHKRIPLSQYLCFFSTLVWGIAAHAMALFNKYSIYEDVSQLFGVGATYESGRWMLDILHQAECFFLGGSFSLPFLNGLATIVYISLVACLIGQLLSIEKGGSCIALGGILVTTPVLTGTFGYMFTAPHYAFGLLMAVWGVVLLCRKMSRLSAILGIVLIACGIGVYQAILPCVLSLMLLWFIRRSYTQDWSAKQYFLRMGYLLICCGAALGLYFVINKLYLHFAGATLSDYQGISTAGQLPLKTYLKRALGAYKQFLLPDTDTSAYMYPHGMHILYRAAQLLAGCLSIVLLVKAAQEKRAKLFALLLPMALLPLAFCFIYVMCEPQAIHSLMVYNHVMLFVNLLWLGQTIFQSEGAAAKRCRTAVCCIVLLLSGLYVRYDNICYLKAQFVQEQTINYFTVLVTQIKSTPGYRDDMKVNFIGFNQKTDETLTKNEGFAIVNTIPYHDTDVMINSFAGRAFIRYWCGFDPVYDYTNYAQDPQVQEMPCYPDEGSIAIINDTVIVKFSQ